MDLRVEEWRGSRVESLPITAISVHPTLGIAMIVRKIDGETEDVVDQVNVRAEWMCIRERRICLGVKIEDVKWVGDKAVIASLDGTIKIIHPHSEEVESCQVAACPLFAVSALDESTAVLISHTSQLYYLNVHDKSVLKRISLGIESRLFSLTTMGESVGIGGLDSIWIVNGKSDEKKELRLARDGERMGTIVWSLVFVRENVLASGDSTGAVSLWNTRNATLITSLIRHEADVLSLCYLNGKIYAAGVDPSIVVIEEMSFGLWKDTLTKRIVSRDVRSLTGWGNSLYGGGADERLFRIGTKPISLHFLPLKYHNEVSCEGMYSLITNTHHVQVWNTKNGPTFMAKIFSSHQLPITASCIFHDGSTIGISTREGTSLYSFNGQIVTKVREDLPSSSLLIPHSSSHLLIVSHNVVYRLESIDSSLEEVHRLNVDAVITNVSVSPSLSFLCIITSRSTIYRICLLSSPPSSTCLRISLPLFSCFCNSSLFVVSSDVSSPFLPCVYEIPDSSSSVSRSFSSRSFFQSGCVSSLHYSSIGLLVSSDEGTWSVLSPSSEVLTLHSSKGNKTMDREILSMGVHDNSLRLLSTQSQTPILLPFRSKRFGMQ
ncbi:hypothetical protein PFISCL1PPCAC_19831 [Pristionchus fissidentatus]|uniref:WD40 domain-containing protein n=1 Tax=Pristionchus fissidentatus TaxID=1538716 RepID=A0AAV5W980_9BILA|nr:hypothetical protein PFISCL1PPCAC_19831 [Pristionchus fissidentatus]